jgi:hypothetical protein
MCHKNQISCISILFSCLLACFGSRAGYYLELEFEGSEDFSVRWGGRKREPVKEELVCRRQQLGMNM